MGGGSKVRETTYSYYANFAVGLCEGEIAHIGRIWANGSILDLNDVTYRVYRGTVDQAPDSLIEAKQGVDNCPAYRGLAYVVFEDLPLAEFGNRIPQLNFEIVRPVGELEKHVRAMVMIPGATEFGYDTREVSRNLGDGNWTSDNRLSFEEGTDFEVSLDHLISICPNLKSIALVVSWFGSDLRAQYCQIRPCVDHANKETDGANWSVAGLQRSEAIVVSQEQGRAAYGGTPSDASVKRAIAAIKERGLEVVLYPFLMMDIPSDNVLPDPWGTGTQAAYPWRGRITCFPGPQQENTADQTAAASAQVVQFTRDQEWSYERFIGHYAQLAAESVGVDAFLIGSELLGLTTIRDDSGNYPFVSHLKNLASLVRSHVGNDCKITYGADWSEYFGHYPQNEQGTVRFHLDPLWADPEIDAVGIDNYMPLSDWRSGEKHLDAQSFDSEYAQDYLKDNVSGGEGYDWYYVSAADRQYQTRTPITDGAHNKPWVFRHKDLLNWWSNPHFDRTEGQEDSIATEWQPQSKPIWFTEIGCPAVHLGASQPNVFPDPKSSESALPYFSGGARDDAAQRSFLTASLGHWAEQVTAENPVSPIYGGPMVDPDQIYLWAWDARPFPAFPLSTDNWSDSSGWHTGHWLNGRLGGAPLEGVVQTVLSDYELKPPIVDSFAPVLDGFVLDRRMSVRAALEGLCDAFGLTFNTTANELRFQSSARKPVVSVDHDALAETPDEPLVLNQMEAWEAESSSITFGFKELFCDYRQSVSRYDQPAARTKQDQSLSLAAISTQPVMREAAKNWLRRHNYSRHSISFTLPPSMLSLEAGDFITLEADKRDLLYRIDEIEDGEARQVSASLAAPRNTVSQQWGVRTGHSRQPDIIKPMIESLDLPILPGKADFPHAPYVVARAHPWPSGIVVYKGNSNRGFVQTQTLQTPAIIGTLDDDLAPGRSWMWDRGNRLVVQLFEGDLSSVDEETLLSGANAVAIEAIDGSWEILQFSTAELIAPDLWRLSGLLRGQLGTESAAKLGSAKGARFVLLDEAVEPLQIAQSQLKKSIPFKFAPLGSNLSDASNPDMSIEITGRGLRPLAPVHLRAIRHANQDLEFSWIRRGRLDADSWVGASIPLGEDEELYQIIVRSAETGGILTQSTEITPRWLCSKTEQSNSGFEVFDEISIEISQLSRALGAGEYLQRNVTLSTLKIS